MTEIEPKPGTQPELPPKKSGLGRRIAGFFVGVVVCVGILSVIGIVTSDEETEAVAPVTAELAAPEPISDTMSESVDVATSEPDQMDQTNQAAPEPVVVAEGQADATPEPEPEANLSDTVFNTTEEPEPMPAPEPEPETVADAAPEPEAAPAPEGVPEPTPVPEVVAEAEPAQPPEELIKPTENLKPMESLKPVEKLKTSEAKPAEPIKAAEDLMPSPEPVVTQPVAPETTEIAKADPAPTTTLLRRSSRLPVVSDDSSSSNSLLNNKASSLPKIDTVGLPKPLIPQDGLSNQEGPAVAKRLKVPQTGAPKTVVPDTAEKLALAEPEAAPAPVVRAIDKNGVGFDAGDRPLMSIILVDIGNSGAPLNSAATIDIPLTFAVPVDRSDAALAATRYAENGHEVLALSPRSVQMSLSGGQSREQVAELLSQFFEIMPHSVGLMDVSEATLQNDRVLSKYVMEALAETGHGLVTYNQGLNVAKREADKMGVPAGLVYRVLDQKGEAQASIQRHLDRAASEANQEGHVLVIGTTRENTIQAVIKWSESRAAQTVAIAPVSAAIKSGS